MVLGDSEWSHLDYFDSKWFKVVHKVPKWSTLDHFGPLWTTLDHFGPLWTILDYLDVHNSAFTCLRIMSLLYGCQETSDLIGRKWFI